MKRPIYAPCVCEVVIGEEGGCAADGVHCHCVHVASGAVWYVNVDPFTGIAVTYAADLRSRPGLCGRARDDPGGSVAVDSMKPAAATLPRFVARVDEPERGGAKGTADLYARPCPACGRYATLDVVTELCRDCWRVVILGPAAMKG